MKKFVFVLGALSLLLVSVDAAKKRVRGKRSQISQVSDKKSPKESQFISAKQAVLIDCETGKVLYGLNEEERAAPSSMTKLMTLYILFSEIAKGHVKLQDEFQVSELAQKQEGSRSFFKAGTMASVEDLIRSIVVHSGNDACVVVAEGLFGDVSAFVKEMNEFAQAFGLKNTHFVNPMGLPDEEHYSSAADLAEIARRLIVDFPQLYHYFSEKEFTVNGISQGNRNTLLGNALGIDGLKTGHTRAGGYGIVVSADRGGRRLIVVVNGCAGTALRAQDACKVLAMGFRDFVTCKIAEAGKSIAVAPVCLGKKSVIDVCTNETIVVSVPKKLRDSLKVDIQIKKPLEAPVKLGDKVGTLSYAYDGVASKVYPLFAAEPADILDWWERAVFTVKAFLLGIMPKSAERVDAPKTSQLRENREKKNHSRI